MATWAFGGTMETAAPGEFTRHGTPQSSSIFSGLGPLLSTPPHPQPRTLGPLHPLLSPTLCMAEWRGFPEAGRGCHARPASTRGPGSQLAPASQESRCFYRTNSDQTSRCPCSLHPAGPAKGRQCGRGGAQGQRGREGCLASSDLPGPPFPAHAPNVFDRWRAGPSSAIQIEKQAWQPALLNKTASAA